jgi:hypothetical protein
MGYYKKSRVLQSGLTHWGILNTPCATERGFTVKIKNISKSIIFLLKLKFILNKYYTKNLKVSFKN